MRARFILGPAGSGKTYLCLEEIRRALRENPAGPPLILLAPKQATFQLERQLLAGAEPAGYTRLQILSFERLAQFILDGLGQPTPPLVSEDGRVMVLHALLARRRAELEIFHGSAGLAGFARQLSVELRELQHHQLSPKGLLELAAREGLGAPLRRKLRDLSLLLGDYLEWLRKNNLQDADCLLDLATRALREIPARPAFIAGLWLDGFAEMTPQELSLLTALAPQCAEMSLAFCLDEERPQAPASWLSIWSNISRTWRHCRERLSAVAAVETHVLSRANPSGRFAANPVLRHLEAHWAQPQEFAGELNDTVRLVSCPTPAAEATWAARAILQFVRGGGRFREAAVLVRNMEGYHDELRRAFTRYQIPFFLDRRQSVAHHPLAELTRSTLRAAVRNWAHADWFGALKSGLVEADPLAVDELENLALAHGWTGPMWFAPLTAGPEKLPWAESRRAKWIRPFAKFRQAAAANPTGAQLAQALRDLWDDLDVGATLERWSGEENMDDSVQATVWRQMNTWLDDVELAFATVALPLGEWLPILEAGLGELSVGVIPPVLDQVLIGAVDRSRNPELKLALVLGVNETIFPAPPPGRGLLSESDREELKEAGAALGQDAREFLSREQFFGYIACTRSSHQLVLTYAQRDAGDHALNPSAFISRLRSLFPPLNVEAFAPPSVETAEHASELSGLWPGAPAQPPGPVASDRLAPELAEALYGDTLRTSVSRLEQFAACSFRFFVHSGLRAEEREIFELDVRERGSFQHEVLAQFHRELKTEKRRWRDLTEADARQRIARIVGELTPQFRGGLMEATAQARFSAQILTGALQDFVAAMVQWMDQYQFDPAEVELGFGMKQGPVPPWELDLDGKHRLLFRGIIDRIDLCRTGRGDEALAVVVDYKSGARKLDRVLMAHGLQLQLAAYLNVLRHLKNPAEIFGLSKLIPAGVFYVNLRGQFESGKIRTEVLSEREAVRQLRYRHAGRFDFSALPYLDARNEKEGTQFNYRLKQDGQPMASSREAMNPLEFEELLDQVETQLTRMGREIYSGKIDLNPYQKGNTRACDQCEYQGICRFDAWTHPYRVLTDDKKEEN